MSKTGLQAYGKMKSVKSRNSRMEEAMRKSGVGKKTVKCSDCPTPEICARKGCQREAVNKNFMGSKGKPVDLDIDY